MVTVRVPLDELDGLPECDEDPVNDGVLDCVGDSDADPLGVCTLEDVAVTDGVSAWVLDTDAPGLCV